MHSARSFLIRDYLLARPSRNRQRLPVQLWGQLLRPCRVLGAATDSWSLQRRCSAAMTRCGRARLAAGAPRSFRLLGYRDQGPASVVSTPARGRFFFRSCHYLSLTQTDSCAAVG
jgi:hypothetical protein